MIIILPTTNMNNTDGTESALLQYLLGSGHITAAVANNAIAATTGGTDATTPTQSHHQPQPPVTAPRTEQNAGYNMTPSHRQMGGNNNDGPFKVTPGERNDEIVSPIPPTTHTYQLCSFCGIGLSKFYHLFVQDCNLFQDVLRIIMCMLHSRHPILCIIYISLLLSSS